MTHWFETAEDLSVNHDEQFGSDDRTLRFLSVALPTLVDQLGATAAVVAAPLGVGSPDCVMSVLVVDPHGSVQVQTRALRELAQSEVAPFWQLDDALRTPAERLVRVASTLAHGPV